MPMIIAPIAGAASDRIGGQRLMGAGLTLQAIGLAWIAAVMTSTTPYVELIGPFLISGVGMALFFAPVANVVLSSVWPHAEGPRCCPAIPLRYPAVLAEARAMAGGAARRLLVRHPRHHSGALAANASGMFSRRHPDGRVGPPTGLGGRAGDL